MDSRVRRAIVGTFLVSGIFMVFTVASKEFPTLYLHTPWENDPYDTTVSFAIFFVPLIGGICLVPLMLVKRSAPLMGYRIRILLRACDVAMAVVVFTLLSDWVSVVSSANRGQWTGTTRILLTLLTAITIVSGQIAFDLYRARKLVARISFPSEVQTDWISDVATLLKLKSGREILVQKHPVAATSLAAALFGLLITASQSRESGLGEISLLFFAVSSCGIFAFLIVADAHLGLIRTDSKLSTVKRRLLHSVVVAAAVVPISSAVRNSLWWIVGSSEALAHLPQLGELLAGAALLGFGTTFIFESLIRLHSLTRLDSA